MKSRYEFKVGDRVKCNGKLGTVKCFCGSMFIGVELDDEFPNAHDLYGYAKKRHGHWAFFNELKKVEEERQTIVIKRDGNIITAYMGKKQAVAKCSPSDDFDLYKGSILALTRLMTKGEKNG